ncbi:rh39 [macacine betaherpesvirus 3]|uniref:Rh39 n=1 Tax=Rhesus cytomegalovirus (strain 68-1) TaxID=47929 RepID=Q2FAT1_RHCM6|nr:rh39 [macacine betaherpesvirus 3]
MLVRFIFVESRRMKGHDDAYTGITIDVLLGGCHKKGGNWQHCG